ncbi:MAG: DUF2313 domain-containing protein [Chitinispirillia bacterium]|nr:DUF2313 domain-containing protein [Chitinispirillia bacterium]
MNHYYALKQLMPIDFGPISDEIMRIEGDLLDRVMMQAHSLLLEFFPSSTHTLLSRWEREYGLAPKIGDSLSNRRQALRARVISVGNMSKEYFMTLAQTLGYQIEITEPQDAFRAGINKAGDRVFVSDILWQWTITVLSEIVVPPILNELFNDLNPPHMRLTIQTLTT